MSSVGVGGREVQLSTRAQRAHDPRPDPGTVHVRMWCGAVRCVADASRGRGC